MPAKGIPRCKCGWRKYWLIRKCETSIVVECQNCGKQRRSTAKRQFHLKPKPEESDEH